MNVRMNEIDWNYREAVARRQRKNAERELRYKAARLFYLRLNAVIQLVVCMALIPLTASYLADNIESVSGTADLTIVIVSFMFTQVCCWTYTLFFPQYFINLE